MGTISRDVKNRVEKLDQQELKDRSSAVSPIHVYETDQLRIEHWSDPDESLFLLKGEDGHIPIGSVRRVSRPFRAATYVASVRAEFDRIPQALEALATYLQNYDAAKDREITGVDRAAPLREPDAFITETDALVRELYEALKSAIASKRVSSMGIDFTTLRRNKQ